MDNLNLEEIRKEISAINDDMLALFIKRMELSAQVAAYKKANGLPTLDRKREEAILQKEYTKKLRVACRPALDGEKRRYAVEVLLASDEELDACRERFIENATAIVSRLEPAGGIEGTRQLDRLITAAANRSEQSVSQPKKDLTPDR